MGIGGIAGTGGVSAEGSGVDGCRMARFAF